MEDILNPQIVLEQIAQLAENAREGAAEDEQQKLKMEGSLKQLEAEEARVLEAYRMGVLSPRLLGQELEKINLRRSSLEATKATPARPVQFLPERGELKRHITDYCSRAASRLRAFSHETRQRFLRVLLDSVIFDGSRVRIRGRIPVSYSSQTQCSEANPLQASDSDEAREGQPGITTTTTRHCGRNTTSDFQVLMPGSRASEQPSYFTFELERSISRAPGNHLAFTSESDSAGRFAA